MTVTDLDIVEMADLEALRLRRVELRARADDVLAALRDMPAPKTYLEACRTLRAIEVADRTLTQLYSPPRHGRSRAARSPQPARQAPGGNAGPDASPRQAIANTVPVATETPAGTGRRPAKGARNHLNGSASALATVTPDFKPGVPAQGAAAFASASPPRQPAPAPAPAIKPFRPGKPDIP